jgi:YHS domain-containing protein
MLKTVLTTAVLGGFLAVSAGLGAAELPHAEKAKAAKLKPYTLKTCVVSNEKLGAMGPPYVYKYKDREIKFCCKGCVKEFNKAPEKYLKLIEEAEKKAAK